jgi:hypothetical protein
MIQRQLALHNLRCPTGPFTMPRVDLASLAFDPADCASTRNPQARRAGLWLWNLFAVLQPKHFAHWSPALLVAPTVWRAPVWLAPLVPEVHPFGFEALLITRRSSAKQ